MLKYCAVFLFPFIFFHTMVNCSSQIVLERGSEHSSMNEGNAYKEANIIDKEKSHSDKQLQDAGIPEKEISKSNANCKNGTQQTCYEGGHFPIPPCRAGIRTCSDGIWGACEGQVLPTIELCNGLDDDCDGDVDSPEPRNIRCYTGPQGTKEIGQCTNGYRKCEKGNLTYCHGERTPTPEVCDNADNNCNGMIDEDDVCRIEPSTESEILIEAGEFWLGTSLQEDPLSIPGESPPVKTYLSAYNIDRYEVTNGNYKLCVKAGICSPAQLPSDLRAFPKFPHDYLTSKIYDLFPVVGVTWRQARAFCLWKKKELPTEAQWERAAKELSNEVPQRFPWGKEIPKDCSFANIIVTLESGSWFDCNYHPARVGSYKKDTTTTLGVFDMAGNVSEWTRDCYEPNWYNNSQYFKNPCNKECDTGTQPVHSQRVVRGGNFANSIVAARNTYRIGKRGDLSYITIGFRCVKEVK